MSPVSDFIGEDGEARPMKGCAPVRAGGEGNVTSEVVLAAVGLGTDSTAMLIEMVNRRWPAPHAILFGDTGGEHPHTYAHRDIFSAWLVAHGYPEITVLRSPRETLEQMCLRLKVLPSIAYGWKTCSQRFKVEPQEKWANNDLTCRAEWAAGRLVTRLIGYEYGEERRVRPADRKYTNRYPLIEWEMDRDACKDVIRAAGLPLPGKSSCFFCPSMKKAEIKSQAIAYPDLSRRAIAMEGNAENLTTVKGLGRRFSWRDFLDGVEAGPELPLEMPCDCFDGAADSTAARRTEAPMHSGEANPNHGGRG